MNIKAIKTEKVTKDSTGLFDFLDKYVEKMEENSILAVTSKVVAICEGNMVPVSDTTKDALVRQEADLYLPKEDNRYGVYITIKNNILAATAGIDESNTDGYFVLWPKDSQKVANEIREYLISKFNIKNVGVLITDSKTTPLRWGVTGIAIAHSGFKALNDLIGTEDLFGRNLKMTKVAIMDGLAGASVLVMGEGAEQTPLSIITHIPFVEFQDRNPTEEELAELRIDIEDDVFATFLKNVPWKKGNGK